MRAVLRAGALFVALTALPGAARAGDESWCDSLRARATKMKAEIAEQQSTLLTISSDALGRVMAVCHYVPVELSVEAPSPAPARSFYETLAALAAGVDGGSADEIRDALAACVGVAGVRPPFERVRQTFSRGEIDCTLAPGPSGFVQFHLSIRKARPG